jgi:predicted amidohydrolase YtcJ
MSILLMAVSDYHQSPYAMRKPNRNLLIAIAAFVKTVPPGTWILNGDWDHTNWGGELPQASWIDSVSADHPVFVQRLDGHMGLANSAAMKLAKISASTADVEGGSIIRDKTGMPEGIFKDNAMGLIGQHISDPSDELKDRALEAAMKYVAENGVTSVQSMGGWQDLEVYRRAAKKGTLKHPHLCRSALELPGKNLVKKLKNQAKVIPG